MRDCHSRDPGSIPGDRGFASCRWPRLKPEHVWFMQYAGSPFCGYAGHGNGAYVSSWTYAISPTIEGWLELKILKKAIVIPSLAYGISQRKNE